MAWITIGRPTTIRFSTYASVLVVLLAAIAPSTTRALGDSFSIRVRAQVPYADIGYAWGWTSGVENNEYGVGLSLRWNSLLFSAEYSYARTDDKPSHDEIAVNLGGSLSLLDKCSECTGSTVRLELAGGYLAARRLYDSFYMLRDWYHIMNNYFGLDWTYWIVAEFGISALVKADIDIKLQSPEVKREHGERAGDFVFRVGISAHLGVVF